MKEALKKQEPKPTKAFRNKYLAAIMAVAALLISFVASAQTDSLKYSQINGYGFKYKRHVQDSVSIIPLSTSPHTPYRAGGIRYRATDSTLQLWTGYQWLSIVTGGTGVDTAYLFNDSTIAIETPDEDFFVTIPGRHWTLQGILNNGSTLTENENIVLADSLEFTSGWVIIDSLRLRSLPSSTDTTTNKPIAINAAGNVVKMGNWPVPALDTGFIRNQFISAQAASFYIDSLARIRYLKVDSFATFTPIAAPTYNEGRLFYDNSNKTWTGMDDIPGTSIQYAYENLVRARNNTGSTINDGQAVFISGALGQNPTIALAKANNVNTIDVIGLATHNINNNTVGKVTTFGLVNDINTSAFNDGDKLWLSQSTAGALTNVKPTTGISFFVGRCLTSHVTQGKIFVSPQDVLPNATQLTDSSFVVGVDTITIKGTGKNSGISRNTKDATLVKDYLTGNLKYRRQIIDTSVAQQYHFNKFHLQATPLNSIWANLTWSPELKLLVATSHSAANPTGVITSPDGITWTLRNTPQRDWRGVAWSPKLKLFAAVASTGTNDGVMTSSDGVTWTQGTLPNSYFYRYIIWVDELNLFIAVANTAGVTDKVITSADGITWTARTCPDAKWNQIAWAPEKQLLVACAGTTSSASQIMTSSDGINWTGVTDSVTDNGNWETITYSQDLGLFISGDFVQSGVGVPGKRIATSPDGLVWTRRNTPSEGKWLSAAWSPEMGMFLCVGSDLVNNNQAMISTDGINWALVVPAAIKAWRRTIWVKELGSFVVLAYYDGATPADNLVQLSRPIDDKQQYLNIYGRDSAQSILGVVNFKDTTNHQKAVIFNDVAYFNDSVTQNTTAAINVFKSKSYFGNRTTEGTNYNFFATSILRTFNEQTLSGNPSSHTTNFGAFQYWYVNSGATINADNAITNHYSSQVLRFAGNATVANGTSLNLKSIRQDLLYTKNSANPGSATITGPTSVSNSNTTVQTTTGATGATGPLTITGWHSGNVYSLQLTSAAHSIESYADIILGKSFTDITATATNRYGLYILPIKQSWVTNGYSIYQSGTTDSNYFAGKIRFPNLLQQVDTTAIKPTGVDAAGNLYQMAGWPGGGADGNGIYGGSGTLPGNVTVTGANNSLTFDDIFAFRINSDYNVIAKANGTGVYSEAVIGAGNIYEIGYTPAPGVFSKGAGVFIDSNNNVGIGTSPPTAMSLYATGASLFIQGLQSNAGNFNRVDNVTTTGNIGLTSYFITIDATAGNVTLTLPAASTAFGNFMGIKYKFQRIDASGNTVTIQRAGSDTINGGTSFTITTQYTEIKEVQCTSASTWAQN